MNYKLRMVCGAPPLFVVSILFFAGCSDYGVERSESDRATQASDALAYQEAPVATGALLHSIFDDHFRLSEEKQQQLGKIEHLAFVVGQDIVSVFRRAAQKGQVLELESLLAPDFQGRFLGGKGTELSHGPVILRTWDSAEDPPRLLDRAAFAEAIAAYGEPFTKVDKVAVHLTQLKPDEEDNLEGPWTARWDMHIMGQLAAGGRAEWMLDCVLHFTQLSDEKSESHGSIDRFSVEKSWQVSSARPLMVEITDASGIDVAALDDNWRRPGPPYRPVTGGSHLLDFDRNGCQDILITGENRPVLYRGLGSGRFENVTESSGLLSGSDGQVVPGAVVADLDNDGFTDLIVTAIVGTQLRFDIYRNEQNGHFRLLRGMKDTNLHQYLRRYFSRWGVADYDGDGLVDLYLAKAGRPAPKALGEARWLGDQTSNEGLLLRNLGNWRFEDTTESAGLVGEYVDTYGVVWFDLEPDGDADLFLANHMGINVLWENQGDGTFEKQSISQGFGGFSMGATAGDLDGDGDPDLYLANMYSSAGTRIIDNLRAGDYPQGVFDWIEGFVTGNELYQNGGVGDIVPLGVSSGVSNAGWSYGPALVDLDGDGALDIYAPAGFQSVQRGKPDC